MSISIYREYIIYCDEPECIESEAGNWYTRKEAEKAALRDGWVRTGRNRWKCPLCVEKENGNHNE